MMRKHHTKVCEECELEMGEIGREMEEVKRGRGELVRQLQAGFAAEKERYLR